MEMTAIQDVSEVVLDVQGLNITRCTYYMPSKGLRGEVEAYFDMFNDA